MFFVTSTIINNYEVVPCTLPYQGTCISCSCCELKTDGKGSYFWQLFNCISKSDFCLTLASIRHTN